MCIAEAAERVNLEPLALDQRLRLQQTIVVGCWEMELATRSTVRARRAGGG